MSKWNSQTPYKRVKVIEYGSGAKCNDAVYHWRELQHVGDNVYKDQEVENDYGEYECWIYLLYPECDVALKLSCWNIDRYSAEEVLEAVKREKLDTAEHFIQHLDDNVVSGRFIGNALIEFAKHLNPEKVPIYQKARLDFIAKREREEKEKQEKIRQQLKEKAQQQNDAMQKLIDNAISIIKNGGRLQNENIVLYDDNLEEHTYNIICYLAKQYGVSIPLKVKGWICNKLIWVEIKNNKVGEWFQRKSQCRTFDKYMEQLINAVVND